MYIHIHIYIYICEFHQVSFHVTLGSDVPLGLVERSPIVCNYMAAEPGFWQKTAKARVKIQVISNEVGKVHQAALRHGSERDRGSWL